MSTARHDPTELAPLIGAGLTLIPLHGPRDLSPDGREIGKAPVETAWTTRNYSDFDAAAHMEAGGNVGVRLDGLIVADDDPRNHELLPGIKDDPLARLVVEGLLPDDAPRVETGGGGTHVYMRLPNGIDPGELVESLEGFAGVEFKAGNRRQVVAPGSVHPGGRRYTHDFLSTGFGDIPEAPTELVDALRRPPRRSSASAGRCTPGNLAEALEALDPEDFQEERRWRDLMMACHHATAGEGRDEFIAWSTGDPTYADHEWVIGRRWDSLHANRDGSITVATLQRELNLAGRGDLADLVARAEAAEDFDDDLPRAGDGRREWPVRLVYEQKHGAKNARFFVEQRPGRLISSDDALYSFEDGVWRETSDARLAAEVRATDPSDVLDVEHVRKMVSGVHHLVMTEARPFEWLDPTGAEPDPAELALFRNGLLDVTTGRLLPHDGRYFATGLPGHDHDLSAECPTWMGWLDEALDPSFHPTLQEWFGYTLTPDVRAHHFMNLTGVKRGGKSTAAEVNAALVGSQHAASALMPDLGSDFGLQDCLDKRLLLIPDAHDVPARNRAAALERIKSITGGDRVSVNRKNRSILSLRLPMRLVVTSNRLPKFIDESGALASRMLIVRFERSFQGREDRGMGAKLAAEMPGIANWALEGLRRLRANGLRFTVGELGEAAASDAARSQSPALRFAEARLEVTGDDGDFTPMWEIYQSYREWALDEGLRSAEWRSQSDLKDDLRAALPDVRHTQRRVKTGPGDKAGIRTYGFSGIGFAYLSEDECQLLGLKMAGRGKDPASE